MAIASATRVNSPRSRPDVASPASSVGVVRSSMKRRLLNGWTSSLGLVCHHLAHLGPHGRPQIGGSPASSGFGVKNGGMSVSVKKAPRRSSRSCSCQAEDLLGGAHDLPHAGDRLGPLGAVAPLDVGADLRPQPEREAAAGEALEVPRRVGQVHRAAGEPRWRGWCRGRGRWRRPPAGGGGRRRPGPRRRTCPRLPHRPGGAPRRPRSRGPPGAVSRASRSPAPRRRTVPSSLDCFSFERGARALRSMPGSAVTPRC